MKPNAENLFQALKDAQAKLFEAEGKLAHAEDELQRLTDEKGKAMFDYQIALNNITKAARSVE